MCLRPEEKCESGSLPGLPYWGFGTELLPVNLLPAFLGEIPITSTQPAVPFGWFLGMKFWEARGQSGKGAWKLPM